MDIDGSGVTGPAQELPGRRWALDTISMGADVLIGVVVASGASTLISTSTIHRPGYRARVHFGSATIPMIC